MSTTQSPSANGLDDESIVRRLAREFAAPAALFDPVKAAWPSRAGGTSETFRLDGRELVNHLDQEAAEGSRVSLWRPDDGRSVWLVLPIRRVTDRLLAVVGFAASRGEESHHPTLRWGPSCPEPALRAWGQQVLEQLRREILPSPPGTGDLLLVARLIRRLRISEPTEQFQQLATNALRAAMNVQAVAWVPSRGSDPVVINDATARLKPSDCRVLVPHSVKESPRIDNGHGSSTGATTLRSIAVASDSSHAIGWLIAFNPADGPEFQASDAELMKPVSSLIASQSNNAKVYTDLKELLFGVIRALTAAIDAKDPYTSGHSERVARIAVRLATELGMPPNQCGDLYLMGLMHDVGKIGVDDAVLKKTGPLTPEEYRKIQSHVEIGVHILDDLKKLNHLLPGVRHHHESYDGSGYPTGMAGDAIPLPARILAVADSYDAMSSTRPYRRRMTPMQIDDILRKGAGSQWDPKVVEALFACRMDLELIRQKGLGESLQNVVTETLGRS